MRFLTDENFNNHVYRALLLQMPGLDIVRVQDVGLSGATDEQVLLWARAADRILLTHDVKTIPALALHWLETGEKIPGILLSSQTAPIHQVIADLLLIAGFSTQDEWSGKMYYLPL